MFTQGTYNRTVAHIQFAITKDTHVLASVMDSDFRGNIAITLKNNTGRPRHIPQHTSIAQLFFEEVDTTPLKDIISHLTALPPMKQLPKASIDTTDAGINSCATDFF